jgi:hypothetical protein
MVREHATREKIGSHIGSAISAHTFAVRPAIFNGFVCAKADSDD